MYSINRETVAESLNETLLNERNDTLLTQKIQRSGTSRKDQIPRSQSSIKAPFNDPKARSTKFDDYKDVRPVLPNFLSQPLQFKYNKDQTKIFAINASQTTIQLEVYSLPEFKLLDAVNLTMTDSFGGVQPFVSLKYIDVSEDEKFILYGNEGKLTLQTLNSMLPQTYNERINLSQQKVDMKISDLSNVTTCGAKFTDNNEIMFVYIRDR